MTEPKRQESDVNDAWYGSHRSLDLSRKLTSLLFSARENRPLHRREHWRCHIKVQCQSIMVGGSRPEHELGRASLTNEAQQVAKEGQRDANKGNDDDVGCAVEQAAQQPVGDAVLHQLRLDHVKHRHTVYLEGAHDVHHHLHTPITFSDSCPPTMLNTVCFYSA